MRIPALLLTSALALPASGQSLQVDLASDEGFRKTCPGFVGAKPSSLSTDAQRVAYLEYLTTRLETPRLFVEEAEHARAQSLL